MANFETDPERIDAMFEIAEALRDRERERAGDDRANRSSLEFANLNVWLRLQDRSLVHGRYCSTEYVEAPEWRTKRNAALGWVVLKAANDTLFWVALAEVADVLFDAPDDYAPHGDTYCGWV